MSETLNFVLAHPNDAADHIDALEAALRALYEECLTVPDFRPGCQVMQHACEALKDRP